MPNCELQTIIETSNVDVYDITKGVWVFIKDTLTFRNTYDFNKIRDIVNEERPKITQEVKEKLCLIVQAKDNARKILENLVTTFGYAAEISFDDD